MKRKLQTNIPYETSNKNPQQNTKKQDSALSCILLEYKNTSQPTECRKMSSNHVSDKWLISRIYRELLKLSNNKQLNFKNGHCWWECKQVQPLWRTVWRFLKKLEIELPYDPAIPLLGIHTKETRTERHTCTPMFIKALFIIARTWKQPRCP